jgi:hypothetical protein
VGSPQRVRPASSLNRPDASHPHGNVCTMHVVVTSAGQLSVELVLQLWNEALPWIELAFLGVVAVSLARVAWDRRARLWRRSWRSWHTGEAGARNWASLLFQAGCLRRMQQLGAIPGRSAEIRHRLWRWSWSWSWRNVVGQSRFRLRLTIESLEITHATAASRRWQFTATDRAREWTGSQTQIAVRPRVRLHRHSPRRP